MVIRDINDNNQIRKRQQWLHNLCMQEQQKENI